MENKNKGIIISIVIILLIVIIGVTIYFTTKSVIEKDETNTIGQEIQDNPDEDNISNIIATPNENESDSLKNMHVTP